MASSETRTFASDFTFFRIFCPRIFYSKFQIKKAHRQNYRHLSIKYPEVLLEPFFVAPDDDKQFGHNDVYKTDFWAYPWPQGLIKRLEDFDRALIITRPNDIIRHLEQIEKIFDPENDADIQTISPMQHLCEASCKFGPLDDFMEKMIVDGRKKCLIGQSYEYFKLENAILQENLIMKIS